MIWLTLLVLPIVAGLHRFAANMGYRYMPAHLAFKDAIQVAAMMAIIGAALVIWGVL